MLWLQDLTTEYKLGLNSYLDEVLFYMFFLDIFSYEYVKRGGHKYNHSQ